MKPLGIIWESVKQKYAQKKYGEEAEAFVALLSGQYKASSHNMEDALEKIIREGEGVNQTKKLVCVMLYQIRKSHNPDEIKEAVNSFAMSIGTSWAFMLAANIYGALTRGLDVSASLHDLLYGLSEAKKLFEERKRSNSESVRIAKFVTPGLYLICLFIAATTLAISPAEFMHRQFSTPEGVTLIGIIIFLSVLSQVLLLIGRHKKFDY